MRITPILLFRLIAIGASTQVQEDYEKKGAGDPKKDKDVIAGTLGALQTEGLIHADQVERTWTGQLASQKLSSRRSRHIYHVQLFMRSGEKVNTIAVRGRISNSRGKRADCVRGFEGFATRRKTCSMATVTT